jgi:hypothetical protein
VNDQGSRSAKLRYTATGAIAALVVVGAIAGTAALAAKPGAKAHGAAAVAIGSQTKTPITPAPRKAHAPQPGSSQPFLDDVQRLVSDGTISTAESQVLDREIQAGRVDTDTLVAAGFSQTQLQAVQQALSTTKRGLAATAHRQSK